MIPHPFSCLHDEVIERERNRDVAGLLDTVAIYVYMCESTYAFIYIHIYMFSTWAENLMWACLIHLYIVCVCVRIVRVWKGVCMCWYVSAYIFIFVMFIYHAHVAPLSDACYIFLCMYVCERELCVWCLKWLYILELCVCVYIYLHMYVCASLFIPSCVGVFPLTCDVNTFFCECDTLVVALYIYIWMYVCVCMFTYVYMSGTYICLYVCRYLNQHQSIQVLHTRRLRFAKGHVT